MPISKPKRFNTLHPNWRFTTPLARNDDDNRSYTLHEEEAQVYRLPSLRFSPMVRPGSQRQWWDDVSTYRSFVNKQGSGEDDDLSDEHDKDELPPPMMGSDQNEPDTSYDPLRQAEDDPDVVHWDGDDDQSNPLNWTRKKKWISTILVSSFTFISPIASTMIAPSLDVIGRDFNIDSEMMRAFVMSIFLLAYAIGPFILGPLSEMYGRVVVLQTSNMLFLVFNTMCGFARTRNEMLAYRFVSGLGGSAPQALGGGVLSDCWRAEERGKAVAIYSLAPFIGPAVGPIVGGLVTQYTTWRWVFWSVSLADVVVQILATLYLPETYAPAILAKKVRKLKKETGNKRLRTKWQTPERSFVSILSKNLVRPFIMLGTQPAIQVMALYRAYLYGLMYLVFSTFALVWEDTYNQSLSVASLNYLSLGIGFVIGLQICAPLMDRIYDRLKKKYNHPGKPEFRVPLMLPGGLLVPIGMGLYGWSAHYKLHWVIPNVGAGIFACGLIIGFQCAQHYVVDSYTRYAASATGAAAFLRTMAGFSFPLFAPAMYDRLGLNWGNTLLAIISLVMGVLAPIGLWYKGESLRARSTYCAG